MSFAGGKMRSMHFCEILCEKLKLNVFVIAHKFNCNQNKINCLEELRENGVDGKFLCETKTQ